MGSIRPLRAGIVVEPLARATTAGGIHLPQDYVARGAKKAVHRPDVFRARVLAVGPDVRELAAGEDVLVHTWSERADGTRRSMYVGQDVPGGILVQPEDIVCALDPSAHVEVA